MTHCTRHPYAPAGPQGCVMCGGEHQAHVDRKGRPPGVRSAFRHVGRGTRGAFYSLRAAETVDAITTDTEDRLNIREIQGYLG